MSGRSSGSSWLRRIMQETSKHSPVLPRSLSVTLWNSRSRFTRRLPFPAGPVFTRKETLRLVRAPVRSTWQKSPLQMNSPCMCVLRITMSLSPAASSSTPGNCSRLKARLSCWARTFVCAIMTASRVMRRPMTSQQRRAMSRASIRSTSGTSAGSLGRAYVLFLSPVRSAVASARIPESCFWRTMSVSVCSEGFRPNSSSRCTGESAGETVMPTGGSCAASPTNRMCLRCAQGASSRKCRRSARRRPEPNCRSGFCVSRSETIEASSTT